jgi:hypothetical protein
MGPAGSSSGCLPGMFTFSTGDFRVMSGGLLTVYRFAPYQTGNQTYSEFIFIREVIEEYCNDEQK